ncbi:MAG: FAD binding domain-containing protein, partial [Candidatus Binatia bacterium]
MTPVNFRYEAPRSLKKAVSLLARHGEEAKLLAGGQSLVPLMKLRLARPKLLIDLSGIRGLNYIRRKGDSIHIGALTTHSDIEESRLLRKLCPLLPQTASQIGDVQVRNRGTIGGSLAHADPTADLTAAVLALDAELKAIGPTGERWLKAHDFFLGFLTTALQPDEILTEIKVPVLYGVKTSYLKAAQRASGFAVVGVAVCLKIDPDQICNDVAIGVTGVTDKAYRPDAVEQRLRGKKLEPNLLEEAAA